MFPRKHYLQSSIKKIAKNLESISSFHDLRGIFLVDIVKTLEVYGCAIVFKYNERIETISEGTINVTEVEQLVRSDAMDHPEYFCFPINRNEEYSSFLIVTQKRTNTVLMMEERQWLTAIISYVAVCLENIHLVRKLTGKLLRLSAYVPDEQEANELNWFRKVTFELLRV